MDKYEAFGRDLSAVWHRAMKPWREGGCDPGNMGDAEWSAWEAVAKAVDVHQQVEKFHAEGHGLTGEASTVEARWAVSSEAARGVLRAQFAGQALQGLLAHGSFDLRSEDLARMARIQADALLAELDKKP